MRTSNFEKKGIVFYLQKGRGSGKREGGRGKGRMMGVWYTCFKEGKGRRWEGSGCRVVVTEYTTTTTKNKYFI